VNVGWKGPTPADISLETGSSLESIPIASGAGGSESNALEFDLPSIRDTEARIRLRSAGAPGELASTTIASAYFSVSTHQIQALDPGANWIVGDFASVTWRGPTLADISLETLDGRMSVPLVTGAGGSATNVKAFVVPLCPDSLMRLRLSATGSDPGDAFSSVVSGAIRVSTFALTEPSAGADWIVGDSASVAWRGATPADISLATLDGRVSVPLATSAGWARSNRVALAVPPCPDTLMRLRLRATSSDPNDALKTVVSGVIRVSPFALTEPFAGARWIVGDPVAVQWRGSTLADVALESPTGSPLAMLASRTGGAPNNRLVVPAPRVPATSGIVRVRPSDSSGYASTAVVSSPSVRIALFEIQSPNGGESWEAGLPQTVRWRGRTPADLEISDDDGQTWEPMATNVGGQSSNELVIEAPTVRATKLRLRVVARSEPPDTFNSDISDASFSIVGPYRFDTLPRRTNLSLVSNQARAELGSVVADIGDWNGDGYRDLAASAPFATANGFGRAGRVDVYLGGPAPSALSVVTLSGAQFDDQFGASIAAGDLDGDGYSDLLVGAVGDGIDRGAVFVFRGRAHPRTSPDAAYRGVPDMHGFGHSIACSGDLNADGKDDFVAAARIYPALVNSKPLVYFGDDSLDTRADVELEAPPGVDVTNFGHQVSAAGDFNGDGWPDVLVRQQSTSSADTTARVIVFRGGPAFDGIADDQIRGSRVQRFAESAFGGVGDVNGDGFDDVAVGVPGAPAGGEVRVYLGGAARGAVWIYSNGIAGEDLGASIAGGDLNADGYSDVFAGAPLNDEGGSDAGSAYAFAGGPERLSLPALSLTGPVAGGRFGTSLALLPRFWDDDVATFVVGAPADERGGVDAGAVIAQTFDRPDLIAPRGGETAPAGETMSVRWRRPVPVRVELSTDGGISWTTIAEQAGGAAENTVSFDVPEVTTWLARVRVRMSGQAVSAASAETSPEPFRIVPRSREVPAVARRFETGWTRSELRALRVIAAGDLDGDRLEDAFLVSSAEAGARIEAWLADASAPAASFDIPSSEAASAAVVGGDFDGDGRMDVAIGMPADATRGANAGAVRIYRHALEAPADVRTLFGERAGDRFGVALASGDVNQSGPPDLIVGAPSSAASAPRPGVAYVYAGGGSFGTSAPEKLSAGFAGDEFGAAVAFVGDLDLDALGEFLVGAPGRVLAGAASGRVYGYERARGASSSLRRGVIGGGADGDRFGAALAACGDVNGDRYEDVLIGAPGADAPEAGGGMLVDAGAASLYFGGPDFNPAADWEAFGTRAGESFGAALAAGGDLNADGFGDWLVCAPFGGSEERGEALAFFGGTLPDRIADARLEGERPGARLGASLAILGEPLPGEFARVALVEGAGDGGTLREFEVRRWCARSTGAAPSPRTSGWCETARLR
jgi:hypothetical protein